MSRFESFIENIKNKNILIQGLGLNGGGVGTAKFFLENSIPVRITDLKSAEELIDSTAQLDEYGDKVTYVLGTHRDEDFIWADIVVKGPGVRPSNPYIQTAIAHGAQIISDIEIFASIVDCPLYAVTGSKGKSGTVSCIYQIFKTAQPDNAFIGGNITISPLSFYHKVNTDSLVILELSSWQLRDLHNCGVRFHGAAFTNLMHDHQNYYNGMEDYLADKMVIAENQTDEDFIILPQNDNYVGYDKVNTAAEKFCFGTNDDADIAYNSQTGTYQFGDVVLFSNDDIHVLGTHNVANLMLAAGFCYCVGIEPDIIRRGIQSFRGTPFRLEKIAEINGVSFINDTTATIPEAAVSAIKSLQNVIWIGGGNDKNLDFSCMTDAAAVPKAIYLLPGDGTDKMLPYLADRKPQISEDLDSLVRSAFEHAESGDVILFSPGATSFGLFANEFDRGRKFNECVDRIKSSP
ncbi:MAG: UDP-N-acetylmuramoyl-L-alanine--D-glutamate ligase [Spirochaetales bacterium]|nr:UDP-N-acetylmuramoyl-L-alanine--D-glutamate ligase [Spirochaetales bacterium]